MKFYNTLTRQKEEFVPINKDQVNVFVCGPTVYDFPHLGNGKTYTQFDVLVKALRYIGFKVFYLQNITDIDDKILNRARDLGIPWKELAEKYEKIYQEDMLALGNNSVDKYARATDFVPEIIKQVETLMDKGYAYKIPDGVYFETAKFKDYGKLSGRTELKEDDSVSRIDEASDKHGWNDFCLWKAEKPGEPIWESPQGPGRPGWHIEDTAITEAHFGPQYDLHGGAVDLIFPHHECEIAQMEAASGLEPLVRYWVHTGFLNIDSKKMSKSLGNFKTIRNIIESNILPIAFRLWVLMSHYRSPMNFSEEALRGAETALKRLQGFYLALGEEAGLVNESYVLKFKDFIEDDLDTPRALALLWDLVKDENISDADKKATMLDFDKVLGLGLENLKEETIPENILKIVNLREDARKNKDFKKSDELRNKINSLGYEVKDTSEGQKVFKK
jgi:cysteinyl-tRNA synthetase